MNSDYKEVFGLEGPLARALPGYAYRPEQAAMAKAVGLALARLEPLIVEAGTGTGKTFAYLVPALLSGRSVIISTGTRTLQDQLFRRDVPLLAKALGLPAKIALLKGRTNYLCRHRLELATQQGSLLRRRARAGTRAGAGVALGGGDQDRRSVRADRFAGAVGPVAEHHLDPRELPGAGVSAVRPLPCVRGAAQRSGGGHRGGESSLAARGSGAQGRGLRRSAAGRGSRHSG
jgi:hypothetical protein